MLFHIAHRVDWSSAAAAGTYAAASLTTEGFIHLSTREQFMATAGRYYSGVHDLVLLEIDETILDPEVLLYEVSTNDELFPHYYAAVPCTAVVRVHSFPCRLDGGFDLPASIGP